ncbi:MAG: ATP-binding cassette domain-containing protein [Actinomycetota bacterium]|nr:ATP-binding cassette domain-containing protein [Actinomycetota bacterium]
MSDAPPPVLEVDDVSASYGPYRALFAVSFTVRAGDALALLGPNGAGKSTVARVVSGLVRPTSGSVRVGGRDVTGSPAWAVARAGLSHVPEGRGVFDSLSVEENLVLAFRHRVGRRGVAPALERAYERFGVLGERRHDRAGTLSGGQQRLLSIAKVLVVPPKVLVADELSLGLAPSVVDDVYRGLADVRREGTALVVVEQQVDRALALASSAVVLERGAVTYLGPAPGARAVMAQVLARSR